MDVTDRAHKAYGEAGLRDPRQAEHGVLSLVTARLRAAQGAAVPAQAAALSDNRRLWARLAADVAGSGNALPADLRARLFYLAEFTEAHSRRVLRGEAGLEPLIEVNAAVMRGLAPMPALPGGVAA